MPTVPLIKLNNGHEIPQIGLGVYLTAQETCSSIVVEALEIGYRHVDTAVSYRNEHEVAQGILNFVNSKAAAGPSAPALTRKDVFFTSKIWEVDHGYERCKKAIAQEFEKVKGLEYIDLLLIHSPNVHDASTAEERTAARLGTWKALQESVEQGIVKSIGVSNYGLTHLKELFAWDGLVIPPAVNQIELHPWLQRVELVEYCRSKGVALEAYSPLTRGQKLREPIEPQLAALAKKYGKSPAQILVRWSLQKGFITLPKSVHRQRLQENFDVLDFEISKADLESLGGSELYGVTGWDPTVAS